MVPRSLSIAIIGAGIGGLTAAASLRQRGFNAQVYERAPDLGEVGAGVQLGPNAMKIVRALGIENDLMQQACEPTNMVSLDWSEATLRYREPLKEMSAAKYGARYATAHRADLHRLLLEQVPPSVIHVGARCVGCSLTADGAVARFADGKQVEADVIIGADGIRSVVREVLFGADDPRFTQQICWRGMVPIECVPTRAGPAHAVEIERSEYVGWLGPQGHVICYPIRAGRILNIFAGRVSEDWAEESWVLPSSREELIEAYAGWSEDLLEMFSHVEHCFKWGIYDRAPMSTWKRGRVVLLGDAAHPMMPTLAQGAAITMEDGYAIGRLLAGCEDAELALSAYDAERRPRASRVQLQARAQFDNNRKVPPPPPLDRDWIFEYDAARGPSAAAGSSIWHHRDL